MIANQSFQGNILADSYSYGVFAPCAWHCAKHLYPGSEQ